MSEEQQGLSVQTVEPKPLEKDHLDLDHRKLESKPVLASAAGTIMISGFYEIGSGLSLTGGVLFYSALGNYFLTTIPTGAVASKYFSHLSKLDEKADKIQEENTLLDPRLKYKAIRLVYQGDEPLKEAGIELDKGDNFMLVDLPHLPIEKDEESAVVYPELIRYSAIDVLENANEKNWPIKAVLIKNPEKGKSKNPKAVEEPNLLRGKKLNLDKDTEYLAFHPEEIVDMTTTPQEIFGKAIETIDDKKLSAIIAEIRKSQNPSLEEIAKAEREIKERLETILVQELDGHFNGPYLKRGKEKRQKEKKRNTAFFRKTKGGFYWIKIPQGEGSFQAVAVPDLLRLGEGVQKYLQPAAGREKDKNPTGLGNPIDVITKSQSIYKRAQLTYLAVNAMAEYGLSALLEEPMNKEELGKYLYDNYFSKMNFSDDPDGRMEFEHMPLTSKEKLKLSLIPIIPGVLMFSAVHGYQFFKDPENYEKIKNLITPTSTEEAGVDFFSELPSTDPVWRIKSENGMDPYGYYIQNTSSEFKEGNWEANEQVDEYEMFPESLEEDEPYLKLGKRIPLNAFGKTIFRVPIKVGTRIGAISLKDKNGEDVDYVGIRYQDGTIAIEVNENPLGRGYLDIEAYLVQGNEDDIIKATEEVDHVYDQKELVPKKIEDLLQSDDPLENTIRKNYKYSLRPPGASKWNRALSAKERLEAFGDLEACTCGVCNTSLVLLDSLDKSRTLNKASGFINNPQHTASIANNDYLLVANRHGFAIDEKGNIVDATPEENDPDSLLTSEYLLGSRSEGDSDYEGRWNKRLEEVEDLTQERSRKAALIAQGLAAMASTLGAIQTSRLARRRLKEENKNLGDVLDEGFARAIPEKTLKQAYNFLTWISYGRRAKVNLDAEVEGEEKVEVLRRIKNNVDYDIIEKYLQQPKKYELWSKLKGGRINSYRSKVFRSIALYLLKRV